MNIKNILSAWALPDRTADRAQLTLRLPFNEYARLHALKEVYKGRSVNDMIIDILKAGLDEVVDALPTYETPIDPEESAEMAYHMGGKASDYSHSISGPRPQFDSAYKRILEAKPDEDSKEEAA
jgi:hypothetical protein